MNYAYNVNFLSDAMMNLGEMTEYAFYALNDDSDRAFRQFIISGYAGRFQVGDPLVVSGMSGTELYKAIKEKSGIPGSRLPGALTKYDTDVYYWIGYITAFYQWWSNRSFKSIVRVIKNEDYMRMYPALHTASEEITAEAMDDLFISRNRVSHLREYRERLGYTQAMLAEKSGVDLRTLQQYEIGDKDIKTASASSVIALAKSLLCEPDDLL